MDDNTVDDQGSGWFEVKKKHRSSSKFSIQNWVGGFSRPQTNGKGKNSNDKQYSNPPRQGKDSVNQGVTSHFPPTDEKKKNQCQDKRVVDEFNGHSKSLPVESISTTSSKSVPIASENVSEKKPDMVRIKWGDLEEDVLTSDHGSPAVEIKFGEIGVDELAMCGTSSKLYDLGSSSSSQDGAMVQRSVVKVVDATCDGVQTVSPSHSKGSFGESCKEICEVAPSEVEITSTTSKEVDTKCNHPDVELADNDAEHVKTVSVCDSALCDGEVQRLTPDEPAKVVEVKVPIVPDVGTSAAMNAHNQDVASSVQNPLEPSHNSNPNSNSESITGEVPDNNTSVDNLSHAPVVIAMGEPEEGESKERFREQLWCFLFENLNRAIDELYLLCELECDLDQVKEAMLVLHEAESDFRELNVRVQEFEKMRKKSSRTSSGALKSLTGDHRRPHALSWEVRRITTSPHRAEILSSSLEAFKKIQEQRAKERVTGDVTSVGSKSHSRSHVTSRNPSVIADVEIKSRRPSGISDTVPVNPNRERRNTESGKSSKLSSVQSNRVPQPTSSSSDPNGSKLPPKGGSSSLTGKGHSSSSEKERERRNSMPWKPVDAWKEKRNWEEILATPSRLSSRMSHSPSMSRRSAERARTLHDKLMSPEKKKKTAVDLRKEAEEKHSRAMRIRGELENERIQKLQRTSEKLSRVSEWHAVRSMKLREGMYARHQRSESRHEAHIAQVVKRAGDESIKVNEVRFITSLNEENKKFLLHQKLHGSEMRRAEKFQVMRSKQKEDMAREEAVTERRKLLEAEKLQRLAETQRRKEEAQLRREEERKASSAAREAKTMEQLRRKEERAKAQEEEAVLLAQRLAERLKESEQRRKVYLEQIRERASMDFRDQSSPLMRRPVNKEGQGRSTPPGNSDNGQTSNSATVGESGQGNNSVAMQQSLKRRIKKVRQRLMALKHEVAEITSFENVGISYRTAVTTARVRVTKWVQDLQKLRQERKEGAVRIGLIVAEMTKFLEGKELELQAARQAGLLDFISSALPASHISKPEACQVTIYLLRLLKVALFVPSNRSYFLAQNLLPPLIPMLSAALESYIKIAASLNVPGGSNPHSSKTSSENFDSISEALDLFLWTVTMIIGLPTLDERQLQMQDGLLELVISYQIIHRLRDLFALYDRPQVEGSPFPSSILLSINLLVVLTSRPCAASSINWECIPEIAMDKTDSEEQLLDNSELRNEIEPIELTSQPCDAQKDCGSHVLNSSASPKDEKNGEDSNAVRKDEKLLNTKHPHAFLLSAISETSLVSLPSLLTAVLLQANNRLSSEQGSYVLPSNFEEVATGVLKILNNLALININLMQKLLARSDLKMEFFHIMSFLLTHCTNNWKVANDKVGILLLESLLLLGYFSLFHRGNQAVLRWGNSPTILHKVCDLPFAFFSDQELMPILAGTLVAACFGCEQNKGVVQQELSTEMILSLLKSCKTNFSAVRSKSPLSNPSNEDSTENTLATPETRKVQNDGSIRTIRSTLKSSRPSLPKGGAIAFGSSNSKIGKIRNNRDSKTSKYSEENSSKLKMATPDAPFTQPLYSIFPGNFIDRAEQFFSVDLDNSGNGPLS